MLANEKRLIDANEPIDAFKRYAKKHPNATWNASGIEEVLNAAQTVDAVEVVHGRWIKVFDDSGGWVDMCNKCKEFGDGKLYCSMCGAKMDGGNEDDQFRSSILPCRDVRTPNHT